MVENNNGSDGLPESGKTPKRSVSHTYLRERFQEFFMEKIRDGEKESELLGILPEAEKAKFLAEFWKKTETGPKGKIAPDASTEKFVQEAMRFEIHKKRLEKKHLKEQIQNLFTKGYDFSGNLKDLDVMKNRLNTLSSGTLENLKKHYERTAFLEETLGAGNIPPSRPFFLEIKRLFGTKGNFYQGLSQKERSILEKFVADPDIDEEEFYVLYHALPSDAKDALLARYAPCITLSELAKLDSKTFTRRKLNSMAQKALLEEISDEAERAELAEFLKENPLSVDDFPHIEVSTKNLFGDAKISEDFKQAIRKQLQERIRKGFNDEKMEERAKERLRKPVGNPENDLNMENIRTLEADCRKYRTKAENLHLLASDGFKNGSFPLFLVVTEWNETLGIDVDQYYRVYRSERNIDGDAAGNASFRIVSIGNAYESVPKDSQEGESAINLNLLRDLYLRPAKSVKVLGAVNFDLERRQLSAKNIALPPVPPET